MITCTSDQLRPMPYSTDANFNMAMAATAPGDNLFILWRRPPYQCHDLQLAVSKPTLPSVPNYLAISAENYIYS